MNITINVDMTPEELRRLMGLPDVQEFNQKVMDHMIQKMQEGVEGYDPTGFFKAGIVGNTEVFRHWMDMFGKFGSAATPKS